MKKTIIIYLITLFLLSGCSSFFYDSITSSPKYDSVGKNFTLENCETRYAKADDINSFEYVIIDNDVHFDNPILISHPSTENYEKLFNDIGLKVVKDYESLNFDEKLRTLVCNSFYTEIIGYNPDINNIVMHLQNIFREEVLFISCPYKSNRTESSFYLFNKILTSYYTGYDSTLQIDFQSKSDIPPMLNISEEELIKYFNNNDISDVEGIWEAYLTEIDDIWKSKRDFSYKIGIIEDKDYSSYLRKYIGVVIDTDNFRWIPKQIKFELEQTAMEEIFSVKFYTGMHREFKANALVGLEGLIEIIPNNGENKISFIKKYPIKNSTKKSGTTSSGSGVIISKNGHIITNQHVIDKSSSINIRIPAIGKEFQANIIIQDKNNDLAILKLADFNFQELNVKVNFL